MLEGPPIPDDPLDDPGGGPYPSFHPAAPLLGMGGGGPGPGAGPGW